MSIRIRRFGLNRWNWSQRAGKWVFIAKGGNGKRIYSYKLEPPKQFIEITNKIVEINKEIVKLNQVINREATQKETEIEKANYLYNYLQELGKQLQSMGKT